MHSQLHVITGQTATGKTSKAINLALSNGGDIISCDSRQVYTYLDIVTGKDIPSHSKWHFVDTIKLQQNRLGNIGYYEFHGCKLWGLDIITPDTQFSSFDYVSYVQYILKNTIAHTSTPIVVGGSYLYLKHLLEGFDVDTPPNQTLRKSLNSKSVSDLQNMLESLDPQGFSKLNNSDKHNPHRLIRKIEILKSLKTNTKANESQQNIPPLTFDIVSYTGYRFNNKDSMIHNIQNRVLERLENGAIEETELLIQKLGYTYKDPGMKTLGYSDIISFLQHKISREELIKNWTQKEVNYAQRQLVFMKSNPAINWKDIV